VQNSGEKFHKVKKKAVKISTARLKQKKDRGLSRHGPLIF
jgi:hypothetical protein